MSDIATLHRDDRFRDLFRDPESPVYAELQSLEQRLLRDRSLSESDRLYFQGKLAGILAVEALVKTVFDRIGKDEQRLAGNQNHRRGEPRAELSFFPRGLQGVRTFPVNERAVQGDH